jgi:hypothetical protein
MGGRARSGSHSKRKNKGDGSGARSGSGRRAASKGSSRWSRRVTETSTALALEPGVFTWGDPHRIALSLKRSAERSTNRKAGPFQSAMSMLNFYINRAGSNLPRASRRRLDRAKDELRALYGKPVQGRQARKSG